MQYCRPHGSAASAALAYLALLTSTWLQLTLLQLISFEESFQPGSPDVDILRLQCMAPRSVLVRRVCERPRYGRPKLRHLLGEGLKETQHRPSIRDFPSSCRHKK